MITLILGHSRNRINGSRVWLVCFTNEEPVLCELRDRWMKWRIQSETWLYILKYYHKLFWIFCFIFFGGDEQVFPFQEFVFLATRINAVSFQHTPDVTSKAIRNGNSLRWPLIIEEFVLLSNGRWDSGWTSASQRDNGSSWFTESARQPAV